MRTARVPATRRQDAFLRGKREEEYRSQGAGFAAPEVAMATEPETPVAALAAEPAVPSLVDRYFTRWYKAGKWRMMSVSSGPNLTV